MKVVPMQYRLAANVIIDDKQAVIVIKRNDKPVFEAVIKAGKSYDAAVQEAGASVEAYALKHYKRIGQEQEAHGFCEGIANILEAYADEAAAAYGISFYEVLDMPTWKVINVIR